MNSDLKYGFQKYLADIRFWILLFFLLRLYGITNPPLEISHNWRQTFTNSIARVFFELNNSIFYPQSTIYGDRTGIVGTEFPLLNYLIALVSKIFGYTHWYGRLINLIVSSFGIYYFYKTLERFIKPSISLNATLILMCSIWFAFSRKIMPDTFSISLTIAGIYYGLTFLYTSRTTLLIASTLLLCLGILCKIPALYLLSIFLLSLLDKEVALKNKILFCFAGGIILLVVTSWYFYWVPYLESLHGNQLYYPRSFSTGAKELIQNIGPTAEKFYFSSLQSFIAFLFFIIGLLLIILRREKVLIAVLSLCTFVFLLFIIKTGDVFSLHNYYVIPYTPIMAMIAAYGINEIKNLKLQIAIIALIMIEGIANQHHDFKIKDTESYKLQLETIADRVSKPGDLIAINGGENPQQLYFSHRTGWRLNNEQAKDPLFIRQIKTQGCKYLFINKQYLSPDNFSNYLKVFENEHYLVFKL